MSVSPPLHDILRSLSRKILLTIRRNVGIYFSTIYLFMHGGGTTRKKPFLHYAAFGVMVKPINHFFFFSKSTPRIPPHCPMAIMLQEIRKVYEFARCRKGHTTPKKPFLNLLTNLIDPSVLLNYSLTNPPLPLIR